MKVNLDAMIPRADFAVESDAEFELDLFQNFPISNLETGSPIKTYLRKPDFQRETNHWTPSQILTFVTSFLDNELIPSLILWKSSTHIFVIDGSHRLSALRAWIEDDYGDGPVSQSFYAGNIPSQQRKDAQKTRDEIEGSIGRFSTLRSAVSNQAFSTPQQSRRAGKLFTRGLSLQWVQGPAAVAETSFFKINSQGTPLDQSEEFLLRNRDKAIPIAARAIIRSGSGNKYWSAFEKKAQTDIEASARSISEMLFKGEPNYPLKTLEVSLGGSASSSDTLSLLMEFLSICQTGYSGFARVSETADDPDGSLTIACLKAAKKITEWITGTSAKSLGLHPAVYFYSENGRHSRFLFLGICLLIASKIRDNDKDFFQKFSLVRSRLEDFLMSNKVDISSFISGTTRDARVLRVKRMFDFLIKALSDPKNSKKTMQITDVATGIGAKATPVGSSSKGKPSKFSSEAKSTAFMKQTAGHAAKCKICKGFLIPSLSVSYDHIQRVEDGGTGDAENCELVHPFCNTGMKG